MKQKRHITVKWLIVSSVLVVIGGMAVILGTSGKANKKTLVARPARWVTTTRCQPAPSLEARRYPGRVGASQTAILSFRVSGQLVSFVAHPGDSVKKGDVLATLDPRDYRSRLAGIDASLAESKAKLRAMKAGDRLELVEIRKAQLASAEAVLTVEKLNFDRTESLHRRKVATLSELDRARSTHLIAVAGVATAKQNLKMSTAGARQEDIDAVEAQIRSLEARRALTQAAHSDTILRAPFTGQVAKTYVENHTHVDLGEPILVLQNIRDVEICIDVPERELSVMTPETMPTATVSFNSLPGRTFPLTWKEMDTVADSQTQTYLVILAMTVPSDLRILPGMSAEVQVHRPDAARQNAVSIPVHAVCSDARGQACVWRIDPKTNKVHSLPVRPGPMTRDVMIVYGNISPGDRIVEAGARLLVEGMRVEQKTPVSP